VLLRVGLPFALVAEQSPEALEPLAPTLADSDFPVLAAKDPATLDVFFMPWARRPAEAADLVVGCGQAV